MPAAAKTGQFPDIFENEAIRGPARALRGSGRRVVWNRTVVPGTPQSVLPRLIGADGIVRDPSWLSRKPGDRYSMTLSTGDRLEGTVLAVIPGRGVQVTVDGWNDGLYRLWLDRVGGESAVNSWLSVYGMPESFVKDFDARMRREIDRVAATVAA